MIVAIAGAVADPRHFNLGMGIVQVSGRPSLLISGRLLIAGVLGIWLAARNRRTGAWLIAAISVIWAVCLGLDEINQFDVVVVAIGALYAGTAIWGIATALRRSGAAAKAASE